MDNSLIQSMKAERCQGSLLTSLITNTAFDPGNA
jgi:hypothetical protein